MVTSEWMMSPYSRADWLKFTVCDDMMNELGMVTTSFFGVRMRVTSGVFSTTLPVVSFSWMRSPSLKGRM